MNCFGPTVGASELLTHSERKYFPHPCLCKNHLSESPWLGGTGLGWKFSVSCFIIGRWPEPWGTGKPRFSDVNSIRRVPQGPPCFPSHIHPSIHSSHIHSPLNIHLLTSQLHQTSAHRKTWPEPRSQHFYMDSSSPCPSFQGSSTHTNWTSPLCSTWLCTSAGGGTSLRGPRLAETGSFSMAGSEWMS